MPALPTQGKLSLSDIATEFGGTAPHSMSEYLGATDGIPLQGLLGIGRFRGKSASRQLIIPMAVGYDIYKADNFISSVDAAGNNGYTTIGLNDFFSVAPSVQIIGGGVTLFSTKTTIAFITSNSSYQPTLNSPNTVSKMTLKSNTGATLFSFKPTFYLNASGAVVVDVPTSLNEHLLSLNGGTFPVLGYQLIMELPA